MSLFTLLLSAAVAAGAQAPAGGLTRIGAAAAVKGVVNAQAPGEAVGRVLGSGKPVFLNDHVTTDAAGRLQVLLLDETVFTIGPNSDMVLDEFVYDPATSAGKVTAQVTKGVFRFVTGKVARKDPGSMKVKLPVGTIGIRGTIAGGQVSDQGSTVILFGPGANNNANENPGSVAVGNAGSEVVLSQPGFGTTVLPGQPPSNPTDMSGQAQQISGALGEPAPQGGSSDSGGSDGGSLSQSAGQDTAAGGASADISGAVNDFTGTLDTTQNTASQQSASEGILDGVSTWEQVLATTLAGLGPGTYSAAGSASCSGVLCTGSEDFTTSASVDFAARTLSGNANINNMEVATLGGSASTSFSNVAFGTTGSAVVTLDSVAHGTASTFDGTQLSFMNRGGVAAQDLKTDLHYYFYTTNSGGQSATIGGSATAVFNPQPQ